jgi:acyl carrier protein
MGMPPIGRPITGGRAVVVDRWLRPAPVGVPGELCLAGAGLARGYLARPADTAEKWVPDPFGDEEPGARLYRTGDLARLRPDGDLEFLGRIDHQVKVRGFRIEPGEIEAALRTFPGVDEAVVALWDENGERRLAAWVTGADLTVLSPAALRSFLRERLPEPLVPSFFVTLPALPRTATGKVDRAALPPPVAAPVEEGSTEVGGPVEELLAGLWAEVLGVERVGLHESFFDLGGHSLLAVRVISKLRDILDVELPLRAVFEAPTVAGLARAVERERMGGSTVGPHLLPSSGARPAEPELSFAQEPMWFLDQLVPGNPFYNLPSAYRLSGPLDVVALERALTEIVGRHEVLRTRFPASHGRPHQRIATPGPVVVPRHDLRGPPPQEVEREARRRAAAEAGGPFDLATGPVLRGRLLRLASEEHVLLLTLHHIVADGWSTAVLRGELAALYGAFCRGAPSPLAAPAVQYADFAAWQRRWLQGDTLVRALDRWQARLDGAPPALEIPGDRPRPSWPSYRGAMEPFVVPPPAVGALQALARSRGATLYMALLAGFQVLLGRVTATEDVVVGGTTAGRPRAELEDLIGLFVNQVALRTDLSGDPSFVEVLDRVRRTALDGFDDQDTPFDKVVERLNPRRDPSRSPVVQVAFEYQEHVPLPDGLGGGVAWTDLGGHTGAAYGAVDGVGVPARLDVEMFVTGTAGGALDGTLVYATDLFDASTMARLAAGYVRVLESVVADPARRISELVALP